MFPCVVAIGQVPSTHSEVVFGPPTSVCGVETDPDEVMLNGALSTKSVPATVVSV